MGNYLNVGNAGFQAATKGVYVDKTEMIAFINSTLGTKDKLTCVSRPRRFGKSYAAQMLCAYYDKSCDSRELFADLGIAKDSSFEEHLNRYDVIYLDITLFIAGASDIKNVVSDIRSKVIAEIREAYPQIKEAQTLFETLANVADATGNKFIFIIDEWDALFREAVNDTELQKEYIRLLRSLFKSSLTDKMMEAAYMTGILPIKKYGTQSALTDFKEYTMLTPKKLGKYFGSYWTRTETYESLQVYIDLNEDGLKEAIVQMLGGARISIDVGTFQNDMTSIKQKDDVLTLLVHLGYLAYDSINGAVFIPNEEVRQEFVRAVSLGRHKEVAKLIQNSDHLLEQTLNMDGEAVAAAIEEVHSAGTAPTFYNNEQALRSVIRFAYISCVDEFLKIEELASGKGYADVVFVPKRASAMPVLLIELKWNKTEDGAINQIKNKNYPQVLKDYGGEILLVGVNYDVKSHKHTCKIERFELMR